ncbi:sulfotransferase domain-containing protein [Streptomyces sp. B6B3]|uniref:sulfotransferase domain-containing protein n=1 Tax=Streptomyces sp. B6B3 TaxID=3153570 RepID=UPI00325CC138
MAKSTVPLGAPRRPYRSFFTDSTLWDRYEPRPGDIVISTPAKVGTTWTQRITSVLVFQSPELPEPLMSISPWLDCTFVPVDAMLESLDRQEHRRFIKTHLPIDALPIHPGVSYVVVARDPRDTVMSSHNHSLGLTRTDVPFRTPDGDDVHTPDMPAISEDPRSYWRDYFTRSPFPWESNGWPFNSPTRHLESWWPHRHAENLLLLHYQDLLDDLDGQMRRVSAFLGIPVNEEIWPELVRACTFDDMRTRQDRVFPAPIAQAVSGYEFFHKGRSGQWRGVAGAEETALYQAAVAPLADDLRAWLTREDPPDRA